MSDIALRARMGLDAMVDQDYANNVGGEKWNRVMQEIGVVAEGILKSNGIPVKIDGDVHATVHFHEGESCSHCRSYSNDGLPLREQA